MSANVLTALLAQARRTDATEDIVAFYRALMEVHGHDVPARRLMPVKAGTAVALEEMPPAEAVRFLTDILIAAATLWPQRKFEIPPDALAAVAGASLKLGIKPSDDGLYIDSVKVEALR